MKKLSKIIVLMVFGLMLSCTKNDYQKGTIINDCTGVYFRINNDDYLICNDNIVRDLETDTEIKIKYEIEENCENQNQPICLLYHPNKGIISILKIKS